MLYLGRAGWGLTLTKPAGVALAAAFFIHHGGFTTFRAQVTDLHFLHGNFLFDRMTAIAISVCLFFSRRRRACFLAQIHIQDLPNAIWQGSHAVRAEAQRASTADPHQLTDDLVHAVRRLDG